MEQANWRSPWEHNRERQKSRSNRNYSCEYSFSHIPKERKTKRSLVIIWGMNTRMFWKGHSWGKKEVADKKLKGTMWCKMCSSQGTFLYFLSVGTYFSSNTLPSLSAAVTSDHVEHDSALSLLSYLHQSICDLPRPAPVEVQPLLPGQRWYESIYMLFLDRKEYSWLSLSSSVLLCVYNPIIIVIL